MDDKKKTMVGKVGVSGLEHVCIGWQHFEVFFLCWFNETLAFYSRFIVDDNSLDKCDFSNAFCGVWNVLEDIWCTMVP